MDYKERLRLAKEALESGSYDKDTIEYIFPELKESEDERIRKALINGFNKLDKSAVWYNGITNGQILAWIEKQSTPQVRTSIEWVNTIDDACDKKYSEEYAHGEYCHEQSFKWGFQEGVDWLEEQGKNNMGISETTKQELEDNLHKALEKETPESWNEFLDKQGDQKSIDDLTPQEAMDIAVAKCFEQGEKKSADKVEPKFKIEEEKWYVCTHTYVLKGKIVAIKGQTYQAEKDNVIKGEDGCLFIDRHDGKALDYFRSWTIQDAKDGDVLFTSSTASHETFIFKSIDEKGNAKCYFAYDSEDGFREGKYHFIGSATNCKPATKEQYDTLMKAMTDAGYTFDYESKELKKEKVDNLHNYLYGEQKPEANPFISLKDFQEAFKLKARQYDIELPNRGYDIHAMCKELYSLLTKQNPTWNKEDDYVFETLFCLLHNEQDKYPQQSSEFQKLEEIENKLKSLKDRVQPQPKQEWSEEDELQMQGIIDLLPGLTIRHNWLKSLKDRYTWKPSEEEIVALEHAINCYSGISPTNTNEVFTLEIMKERLKNLTK